MKAVEEGIARKEAPLEESGNDDDRCLSGEERRLWSRREEEAIDDDDEENANRSIQLGRRRTVQRRSLDLTQLGP